MEKAEAWDTQRLPYVPNARAVVVAAHAARIAVRDKQQSNTVRSGSRRCGAGGVDGS